MGNKLDLAGQSFGKLTAISEWPERNKHGQILWLCECACGGTKIAIGAELRSGHVKSCGCLQPEAARAGALKHGARHTRLYKVWAGVKQRCRNPNNPDARYYSKRGIDVCEEWLDFLQFKAWAERSGYRNDLTLDRIDNDKGYGPNNCRWATREDQSRNRSDTIFLTYKGETLPLTAAAQKAGLDAKTVRARLARGWPKSRALVPLIKPYRGKTKNGPSQQG